MSVKPSRRTVEHIGSVSLSVYVQSGPSSRVFGRCDLLSRVESGQCTSFTNIVGFVLHQQWPGTGSEPHHDG
jgi:hypothetical protein